MEKYRIPEIFSLWISVKNKGYWTKEKELKLLKIENFRCIGKKVENSVPL